MRGQSPGIWLGFAAIGTLAVSCSGGPDLARVDFPGSSGSAQARLTSAVDGTVLLSWLEPQGPRRALKFAQFDSGTFGLVHEVVQSDRMFVNWADFPSIVPISDSFWFAHWLERRPDSAAYDIATLVSEDGGASWTTGERMNEDDAVAEHGFVDVFDWNGAAAAFWLDGRDLANWSFDDPDALLGTSLRLARYDRRGITTGREVVDELVCDCCQPDVAMTAGGPIVAYRDRTVDEIRDVVVRRWVDGGWSSPIGLGNEGWFIEGCPVNGPAIAARDYDVAAVWFTAAAGMARVRLARSDDGGLSFGSPIEVDGVGSYGQPDVVLDASGRAVVSWWRRAEEGGIDLLVRAYDRAGRIDAEIEVAHESVGQPIDVPQLVAVPGGYLVAWTTFDESGTVRLAQLDL